jgi:hypothetical protein
MDAPETTGTPLFSSAVILFLPDKSLTEPHGWDPQRDNFHKHIFLLQ